MTQCGVCNQNVDLSEGAHVHDPKRCTACEQFLPANQFALHPSSADGRRHQCLYCVKRKKSADKRERSARRQPKVAKTARDVRNRRFTEHGFKWVIRTPDGRVVTIPEAEAELEEIELQEYEDDL